MCLTILSACRIFPLFFPHIYSASTDKSPSVTWPCLPAYSSSFIFITANSPKSRFYSGKNTFKFMEMSYSFILGPWHFFCFLSLKNYLSLLSPDFSVQSSDQLTFLGEGEGALLEHPTPSLSAAPNCCLGTQTHHLEAPIS